MSRPRFDQKMAGQRTGASASPDSAARVDRKPVAGVGSLTPALHVPNQSRLNNRQRESLTGLASLLPAFLLVGLVIWYPVTQTFYRGFTDWNGATATWVGMENYVRIFTNGELFLLLRNNVIFLLSVPGILIISLIVAMLLFEEVPGWTFFRSVYYLPTILSAAVVGMLMRIMFSSRGAVNTALGSVSLDRLTHDWLGSVPTAFMVLILVFYWQTLGQGVLIFLAGLAAIPTDLIEAAKLDGANWFQRVTRIVVPLLVPAIAYFVVVNVIWVFVGLFALVFTVTNGGPGYATTPFDLMIYRKAFESGEMGYASALSVILFFIVLVISILQLRVFDRLSTD